MARQQHVRCSPRARGPGPPAAERVSALWFERLPVHGRNHMVILVLFAFVMLLGMYAVIKGVRFLSWLF